MSQFTQRGYVFIKQIGLQTHFNLKTRNCEPHSIEECYEPVHYSPSPIVVQNVDTKIKNVENEIHSVYETIEGKKVNQRAIKSKCTIKIFFTILFSPI